MRVRVVFTTLAIFLDFGLTQTLLASGVSDDDQQTILDSHNNFRITIATGTLEGQPRGVNLLKMKYDSVLAERAQEIADTMTFAHVAVSDDRWSVGQNIYLGMSTGAGETPNWAYAISRLSSEYSSYNYSECCTTGTGHYTQIAWATTDHIGCGFSYFLNSDSTYPYQKFYVCNYGPAGNVVGVFPYETGESGCEDLC